MYLLVIQALIFVGTILIVSFDDFEQPNGVECDDYGSQPTIPELMEDHGVESEDNKEDHCSVQSPLDDVIFCALG